MKSWSLWLVEMSYLLSPAILILYFIIFTIEAKKTGLSKYAFSVSWSGGLIGYLLGMFLMHDIYLLILKMDTWGINPIVSACLLSMAMSIGLAPIGGVWGYYWGTKWREEGKWNGEIFEVNIKVPVPEGANIQSGT